MMASSVRNAIAVGAAAFGMAFSQMDANPALFLHDRITFNQRFLDAHFQGKTLWITGASSGIGAELAIKLSEHGANLILTARPSDRLSLVAAECQRRQGERGKGTVTVVPADLAAKIQSLEETVDEVLNRIAGDRLDYVVLNAGVGQLRPSIETDHTITEQVFQVNTMAPIALTQLLLARGAIRHDRGTHLIVTSSVAAKFGVPLSASYAASKHALHGYYNSLKAELPWLRVDLICPGSTDTNFHSSHVGGSAKSSKDGRQSNETPGKKMKMPASRCSRLLISCMTMNHRQGGEYWIADHPVLFGLYVNHFFPTIFQRVLSKVGPLRVKAWEQGLDLYDYKTWKKTGQEERTQK
jgi:dehydrogenase/reductase SDR family protein 7